MLDKPQVVSELLQHQLNSLKLRLPPLSGCYPIQKMSQFLAWLRRFIGGRRETLYPPHENLQFLA